MKESTVQKDKTKQENEKARFKKMMEKLSDDWDDFQFFDLLSWRQVEEKKIWINTLQYSWMKNPQYQVRYMDIVVRTILVTMEWSLV
jgi:hypothetical protein